ncbi:flagellar hook-associated protein 2 [Pseudomonas oryzihabitans]|uniref:Flagellar hook-associated protein 2 n=1 Tax=Pseudomonas flavocrustae TaxID=2991719 RepID=A0ABT6IC38_9PSED|nr:flagellar filament capping protein FliD [Pseudomonas sp. CBMAI 2609]MDH4761682.1 flagellar filament capping protein FliD [Pseudomonas sp. CBMAI 2609]
MTTISSTSSTSSTTSSSSTSSTTSNSASSASATSGAIKSSTGLGSGINIGSIVEVLVNAQTAGKQQQITTLQNSAQNRLTAVGTLTSALNDFQLAVANLNTTTSFAGLTTTSSTPATATATVDATAVAGTYALDVSNLATASKVGTQYISSGTTFGSGSLTLSQNGKSYNISVSDGASLSNIRDSINKQSATSGISANVVTDSTGSRLVLSSTTTGANSTIGVSTTGSSSLASLAIDGTKAYSTSGGGYLVQGTDAKYTLDGLSMTSSSNTLDTAVTGVTFTLAAPGKTDVTVGANTSGLQTNIQTFVDAYNTLVNTIGTLTKVSTTTGEDGASSTSSGALTSDAMTRTLMRSLQSTVFGTSAGSGNLKNLTQLGISMTNSGNLTLNSSALSTALATNASDVQNFFSAKSGLLNNMNKLVNTYTQSGTGLIAQEKSTIQTNLTDLKTQQTTLTARQAKLTDILTAKYNAMDSLVAKLNSTSSSVLTTLNVLNKNSSSS